MQYSKSEISDSAKEAVYFSAFFIKIGKNLKEVP